MTDGATDILNLFEMPTDAYKALKETDPEHELCKLYEAEWLVPGPKPDITSRFATLGASMIGVIVRFTDAMWAADRELKGLPPLPVSPKNKNLPPDLEEKRPPHPPINW